MEQGCLDTCMVEFHSMGSFVFYDLRHQLIFSTMVGMQKDGHAIDTITLAEKLKSIKKLDVVGGYVYLHTLSDSVPSASNLGYYIDIVVRKAHQRRLLTGFSNLEAMIHNDKALAELVNKAEQLIRIETKEKKTFSGVECGNLLIEDMEWRRNLNGELTGLDTGFNKLNQMTAGLQYGEHTVIAARPSNGKTAIGINIFSHVALNLNKPSLFCSLEMSTKALMRRMTSANTSVPMKRMRDGNLREDEIVSVSQFASACAGAPLHIYDVASVDVVTLCAVIRRHVRKYDVKLVVIDYLQKIIPVGRHDKRTYEVGHISTMLTGLAKELEIVLISLAQLSRESEKEKGRPPKLSDLADSGQIERDADVVILIDRNRDLGIDCRLLLAKQRDGDVGSIPMVFEGWKCLWKDAQINQTNEDEGTLL